MNEKEEEGGRERRQMETSRERQKTRTQLSGICYLGRCPAAYCVAVGNTAILAIAELSFRKHERVLVVDALTIISPVKIFACGLDNRAHTRRTIMVCA